MPALKIFVKDEDGNELSCVDAAKLIPGLTAGKIRYYISSKGAKTMSDVATIVSDIKTYGVNRARKNKCYDTIYGPLTSFEIWERHPHNDEVTINAVRTRINSHGAMYAGLWEGIQFNSRNVRQGKRKICKSCGRKLEIRQFELFEQSPSGRREDCKRCRGTINNVGKIKSPRKKVNNRLNVKEGNLVLSDGNTYYVSECFRRRGCKAKIAAFRVMESGQVLRRTTINLDANWSLIA